MADASLEASQLALIHNVSHGLVFTAVAEGRGDVTPRMHDVGSLSAGHFRFRHLDDTTLDQWRIEDISD